MSFRHPAALALALIACAPGSSASGPSAPSTPSTSESAQSADEARASTAPREAIEPEAASVALGPEVSFACGAVTFRLPEGGTVQSRGYCETDRGTGRGWVGAGDSLGVRVDGCTLQVAGGESVPEAPLPPDADADAVAVAGEGEWEATGSVYTRVVQNIGQLRARSPEGLLISFGFIDNAGACPEVLPRVLAAAARSVRANRSPSSSLGPTHGSARVWLPDGGSMRVEVPEGFWLIQQDSAPMGVRQAWKLRRHGQAEGLHLYAYAEPPSLGAPSELEATIFGEARGARAWGADIAFMSDVPTFEVSIPGGRLLVAVPVPAGTERQALLDVLADARIEEGS